MSARRSVTGVIAAMALALGITGCGHLDGMTRGHRPAPAAPVYDAAVQDIAGFMTAAAEQSPEERAAFRETLRSQGAEQRSPRDEARLAVLILLDAKGRRDWRAALESLERVRDSESASGGLRAFAGALRAPLAAQESERLTCERVLGEERERSAELESKLEQLKAMERDLTNRGEQATE